MRTGVSRLAWLELLVTFHQSSYGYHSVVSRDEVVSFDLLRFVLSSGLLGSFR